MKNDFIDLNDELEIEIKYHNTDLVKILKLRQGDWYDLRAAENVILKQWDYYKISLGISIKLPSGYEAHVVPRSSTFEKFGILQTNSMGVIDESYCGDGDVWRMPVLAVRQTSIEINDRICQFKIVPKQKSCSFKEVDVLGNTDRGGFGSTGHK